MTNSTSPEAISAPRPMSPASPNLFAMFAANVLPPGSVMWQLIVERGWTSTSGDRDRLAERPAEAEHRRR